MLHLMLTIALLVAIEIASLYIFIFIVNIIHSSYFLVFTLYLALHK